LFAVSHLDLSQLSRKLTTGGLEIYADPLLENVFFALAGNVIAHGKTATAISLWYYESPEALVLIFEDNGQGIPSDMKEKIFERRYGNKTGMGLYLAREILSITGISIRETGTEGEGARFEIVVPKQAYRF
jgi:signal transduction histidine kinase